ncbi:RusA family crossover junction endodeoxyribonuclease [Gordonia sp. 'Campus']|uniref:RusA family crossover junction endodeoxyribonuclease n=1 Tax=Gordonia sp. 'Campus' TaxID=2915824 RepID=UPI001EE45256|nr:RusA family crossover junction endodeoxyribonuclease [Gordonia sp. 'Campus']
MAGKSVSYSPDQFLVEEFVGSAQMRVSTQVDPPSLQASGAVKNAYKAALSKAVAANTTRFFDHDVSVTITWFVSERRRYRTSSIADLDNVLKPTIDALVGPAGVLFDDNQVQSIQASWRVGMRLGERGFDLKLEALRLEDFVPRGGRFVEIRHDLCYYVPAMPAEHARRLVDVLVMMNRERERFEAEGWAEDVLWGLTPLARPFPRARLSRFELLRPDQF